MTPDPVARLRSELDALERAYSPGHHGPWAGRRRADLVDAAVAELARRAGAPAGTAIAAVGGYGRRMLLPRSDLDLLVLHQAGVDVEDLTHAVLYPLWDAGFEVGHAVRTVAECREACSRLDVAAAMLDLRHVAGEEDLSREAAAAVGAWAGSGARAFVAAIAADAERRRERFGSTAHLLEPDLKEGSGGPVTSTRCG